MIERIKEKKKVELYKKIPLKDREIRLESEDTIPLVHLSVENIEIEIEEEQVYRGSFAVESENGLPIQGYVYSTNDKVIPEVEQFSGKREEIPYYFKGKLDAAGSEFEGDFVVMTNGGEFNIPFRFIITSKKLDTSVGPIATLQEFEKFYESNPKEAEELFFLPRFEEVFLAEKPEDRALYHNLMKSRSKKQIVEEFLIGIGVKDAAVLSISQTQMVMDSGSSSQELIIHMEPYGYVEGVIKSQKGQVQLSLSRFQTSDFVDGDLHVQVEKNQNFAVGNDIIEIKTVHQKMEVGIEWWGTLPAITAEQETAKRVKRERADLLHNYLYFRTGNIEFEDFARDTKSALDDLIYLTDSVEYKLYQFHLLLMEERQEEAEQKLEELDKLKEENTFASILENYFLYLKAMFYRTPESISQAVLSIRGLYESAKKKAEAFWMLIYLDRDYVYNKKLQYDTIRQLFEAGENSSLLYFEACEILNDNPGYLDQLGTFELNVIRWGVRYGYISLSLAYQFARLSLRVKYYNSSIYHLAVKLYQVEPDERFLQVICSLLIKGNRFGREYNEYFKLGVSSNLKIIGLNEFYIRSMNFKEYERIPQRVLIYFTYSNSLDVREKAYLYCNILKNKELYAEVFDAYFSKMSSFVEEQLLKGRINEHLAYLYTYFQKEILEKPENSKAVCDILFYRRLICDNPEMIGVYVSTPENGGETYYPLSGGECILEIFNQRTKVYFVDSKEQRYVSGIPYHYEYFLNLEQMPGRWISKNLANAKLFLTLTGCVGKTIHEDDIEVLDRLLRNDDYEEWIRQEALEELLVYYGNHQDKEKMARLLERTDYSNITKKFRKQLMVFYLEVGMTEHALFGVELYGTHIMTAAKRLKIASFGVQQLGDKKDETVLCLCYTAFIRKKHNKDTLTYLMRHFDGEMEDLLSIWERSKKFELDTTDFETHMIKQAIFTSNESDSIYPVFRSYYEKMREDDLSGLYLKYLSTKELIGRMELPDDVHVLIGNEILDGRITDRETKIHMLYHFAGKPEWHERVSNVVTKIMEEFLAEKYYLPVYHTFDSLLDLPVEYREYTFLTYCGEAGKQVILYYQIEGEEETNTVTLNEVIPGHYLCSLHFYRNDHVIYQLEVDGTSVDEKDLKFETFEYEGEESRFFALNHLSLDSCEMEDVNTYLSRSYFTDHYMTLL